MRPTSFENEPPALTRSADEYLGGTGLKKVPRHRFGFGADHLNQTGSWDPNELAAKNWLRFFSRRSISQYEHAVREIYLGIARDVTQDD